jgi:hypothetical protein
MRLIKVLGVLLALGCIPVSAASATAQQLWVTGKGGNIGRPGSETEALAQYGVTPGSSCEEEIYGQLATNARPADTFTFSEAGLKECTSSIHTTGGHLSTVVVTVTGAVTLKFKPNLELEEGGCVYEASKLSGRQSVPGEMGSDPVSGPGRLKPKLSGTGCAKTKTIEGLIRLDSSNASIWSVETITG